jgi:hypothetical protein
MVPLDKVLQVQGMVSGLRDQSVRLHHVSRYKEYYTVVVTWWRECSEPRIAFGSRSQTRKQTRDVECFGRCDSSAERYKQGGLLIERNQMPVAGVGLSGHYKYSTLPFVTPAMQARPSRDLILILGHQASAV